MEEKGQDRVVQVLAPGSTLREPQERLGLRIRPRTGGAPKEEGTQQTISNVGLQELLGASLKMHLRPKMHLPAPHIRCQDALILHENDAG